MPKYGMVTDLQKCVGCGACAIACKTENNTQDRAKGQTFNWADFIFKTEGKFPNVKYTTLPVLCNHCTDAPCVRACPVTPKAMHKHENGMTIHNQERCVGCQLCQEACPYSTKDVDKEKAAYSVISFNDSDSEPQPFYRDSKELIPGCTASGAEVAKKAGDIPPPDTLQAFLIMRVLGKKKRWKNASSVSSGCWKESSLTALSPVLPEPGFLET